MTPAPYSLKDLSDAGLDERAAGGPMAAWLGARFTVDELYDGDVHDDAHRALLPRVRAWPVPLLRGLRMTVPHPLQLSRVLLAFLKTHLPGISWETDTPLGPLQKYLIVHESLAAPMDETTGQPMSLEIFGMVRSVDGHEVDSDFGEAYWYQMRKSLENRTAPPTAVLDVEIRAANYGNIAFPGVGVPFYL